jgi:hypothetical protein
MAAWLGNYTNGTRLSDLVTRPEFLNYQREDIYNGCKWIQSGAVVRNTALDAKAGGVKVQVPFFKPIDPTEVVVQDNSTWGAGGYVDPQKITAGDQVMPILHRTFAYASSDIAAMGSGTDPLAAVRSYITKAVLKLRTRTLISQLNGIFGAALTGNSLDVSKATAGATEANFLSAANVIRAKHLLGERADELSIIAMHSSVYAYLQAVGALTFSTSALSSGGSITWGGGGVGLSSDAVAYFMGLRVIVDDMLAPTVNAGGADQFPCFIMAPGAVAEGVQQEMRIEADRNILSLQDVLQCNYHYGFHIMGTKYGGADNPDNTVLGTAGSWTLAYTDRRMTDVVRLTVNTPYATNV